MKSVDPCRSRQTPGVLGSLRGRGPQLLAGILLTIQSVIAALPPLPALAAEHPPQGAYVAMRHGESVPSAQQRICSAKAAGIDPRNGLTARGREEARAAARAWIEAHAAEIRAAWQHNDLAILSSPFSRTRETAEILVASLQEWQHRQPWSPTAAPPLAIRIEPDLRERDFGRFEGQSPSGPIYRRIWAEDARNPSASPWGVESAEAVQNRVAALITRLEEQAPSDPGRLTVLVSHGDTLKILQAWAHGLGAAAHQDPRQVPPFQTGEIRALLWQRRPAAAAAGP